MARTQMPQPPAPAPIHEAAALHRAGRYAEACAIYNKILKKNPRDPDALHLLGLALHQQGDSRGGLPWIVKAVAVRDAFPDAHANAAQIAGQLGELKVAEHHARRAAALRPDVISHGNLGRILRAQERLEEAVTAFRAAYECNINDLEGCIAYARGLRFTGDASAMLAVAEAGLKRAPDHPTLQLLASEAHFALGNFGPGWHAYRHRFRSLENKIPSKPYALPIWQGEDLTERGILVWAEQGPGDEIMYANMYADVVAKAGRCFIQATPRIAPIMRRSFPDAVVFDRDLTPDELAEIDYQSPAASLGEWLRRSREDFPQHAGYLKCDTDLRDRLRARYLGDDKNRLLVGIAWRSANTHGAADKSLNVLEWGPILGVPGVVFVNLQYGDSALELSEASSGFGVPIIHDASVDPLRDMDSYAAQVAAMDVVVSSSNTAAHVAGALGIPTICMLPATLDHGRRWYWFAENGRTPWYPALRLLIQKSPGDWLSVIRDAGLAVLDAARTAFGILATAYHRTMAQAFAAMNRPDDAQAICEHMARDPADAAEAHLKIADLRKHALDADGVFANCEKAIAADPSYWRAYNLKGTTLADLHRYDEAIAAYREGLRHNSLSHVLHANLGQALYLLGRNTEALHHHEVALANIPAEKASSGIGISINYAGVLHSVGESERALEISGDVIARAPENIDAHYNRALIRLSLGQLGEGWPDYAWRLKRPDVTVGYQYFAHVKPWTGEPLARKKILIWTEQGIGDEILMSTMIHDAVAAARETVILCSERLVPLFRRSFPRARVDERKLPLPKSALATDFDFQMSVSDLGRAVRPSLESFTPRAQTLVPDAARSAALRKTYSAVKPGNLIVGISWASPKNQEMGWLKASRLETWRAILEVPGITFVNLQYGDQRAALAQIRDSFGIEIVNDMSIDALKDMDAYAAQVAAMDLVISTSNTLVHVAGAVGTPTWVLLAKGRGQLWYWFNDRPDSPWYSSVRLLRQESPGDWKLPFATAAHDLANLVQDKKVSGAP